MLRNFTLILLGLFATTVGLSQTSLQGKITQESDGEAVLFATIALYKNDVLITGTESDFDGNYFISDLDPGTYDLEVSFLGLQTNRIVGVFVKAGKVNKVDVKMVEEGVLLDDIIITEYKVPLVEFDNTTQGAQITSEKIQALPTKNINAIAATTAGLSSVDGGDISIRGSRSDATYYYIDGVRVNAAAVGNSLPQAEIDQLQVITGGIEASYGDVTGGIISLTTKGPSQRYSGGMEVETSEYLDDFGYNLINGQVSGPIIKNKEGKSIIGFRLFGQYRNVLDDGPSAVGVYRAPLSVIEQLEEQPLRSLNGTLFSSAEFLHADDIGAPLKTRPNETDIDYNFRGKIDARLSSNIDITVSGTYYNSKNQFAPSAAWEMFNWTNNPFAYREGYVGNFRFRHKLGSQKFSKGDTEAQKNAVIRNASYTIQFGYDKLKIRNEDLRHEDRIFNYGYYGNIAREWSPVAAPLTDPENWGGETVPVGPFLFAHQGYLQMEGEYTPNLEINPAQARINRFNGLLEDEYTQSWDLYTNVGREYNRFSKSEEDRYTINVTSGFDFLPGGSERGKHNIQFGFMYEQRITRAWNIAPRALWTIMRLEANRHLNGVDTTRVVGTFTDPGTGLEFTQYAPFNQENEFRDNKFFRSVRDLLGLSTDDYVNTDGLDPNALSLDMFSPGELNNFGLIAYRGYDYLGNKLDSSVGFNDFFTGRDENGVRTFLVAPWQPIYGAGYIQDKFTYKDIIFRLGLRIDYYDANAKVLKDPYSLTDIESASEFFSRTGQSQPASVSNEYKVYVAGEGSEQVVGYRQGDQWFRPDGTSVAGGQVLFGGGLVFPSYVEKNQELRNITNPDFDPDIAFKDYDPQLNLMPRLAFSFPISESAGFFAHYDILVQRPPSNVISTALDYFYFNDPSRFSPAGNPDLKPEKTIDYEVGFQQKISNSSALKISAYYKEMRDMIQSRVYAFVPAPVNQYETYGNLDFGTVKGFSFNYDLRRTGNFELNATYTLQFADGSGSDANTSRGLNQRGNIRTLFPLSFDERHRLTAVADYRYSSGKNYTGPRIAGKDIFANAGVNLLLTAVSGRPYSSYLNVQAPLGQTGLETINGSRYPWTFNADLQVDKNFDIKFSEESQRSLGVNVYLRVANVFNIKNVINVYNVSGDPDNDGYLVSQFGTDRVSQIEGAGLDLESFLATYQWRILAPNHYTQPRRIYLGAILNF